MAREREDLVAGLEAADAFANSAHDSGDIAAENTGNSTGNIAWASPLRIFQSIGLILAADT